MRGNDIDFKKIIMKARDYPDLPSWRLGDPKTYMIAEKYNVLERPEVCRHMRPESLARISWEDVVIDLSQHKTLTRWRRNAPTFYWKCVHEGWIDRPEIVAQFGKVAISKDLTLLQVIGLLKKYGSLASWRQADPETYRKAKKRGYLASPQLKSYREEAGLSTEEIFSEMIESPGLLVSAKSLSKLGDSTAARAFLDDQMAKKNILRLCDDIFVKPEILEYNAIEARVVISKALIKELHWKSVLCCSIRAYENRFPLKQRGKHIGLENTTGGARIDLSHLRIPRATATNALEISKTTPERMEMDKTRAGIAARALMGTRPDYVEYATDQVLMSLSDSELIDIRRLVKFMTPTAGRAIRKALG